GNQFKILDHAESKNENFLRVQHLDDGSNNQLLQAIIPAAEILSFEEIIPSMNDVFIKAVQEDKK
ncbi:MAG: DUF4162 domain-containing protein, partial [Tangfeifania sp.]